MSDVIERAGTSCVDYGSTVALLGQVIALHATRIARERSRPRPDRSAIAELEASRNEAVAACRALTSADPAALERICERWTTVFLALLTNAAGVSARTL
ncbi:MAG: hypothetical protein ACT4PP_01910 [Sporichthyaceae bacterium]